MVSSLTHAMQGFLQALHTQRKVYASNSKCKTRFARETEKLI